MSKRKPRKPSIPSAIASPTRRIAMLAYPDAQVLDIMGPLEVFSRASRLLEDQGRWPSDAYTVEILGLSRGAFAVSSGLRIHADHRFDQAGPGIDTLMIAGGRGAEQHCHDPRLLDWIRRRSRTVRRLASVCTGAFLLAEAGLLDGRRATTHWASCALFAARYPHVRLEADTIYVKDGAIYTSAGVTAGMDLALAMVEEDFGRELALATARQLVMYLCRPGGQSQFSAQLSVQLAEREPLRDVQAWIVENPGRDLSVPALARRAAMSPRSFWRVFTREVGMTPARFVTSVRVEAARRLLEETSQPLETICAASGFGSRESMRRAFLDWLGVTASHYRQRFARPQSAARGGTERSSARRVS